MKNLYEFGYKDFNSTLYLFEYNEFELQIKG